MKPDADVYQNQQHVATISRSENGYQITRVEGAPLKNSWLASTLQESDFPCQTPTLHPYFLNLLPEGTRLQLLLDSKMAQQDELDLLLLVGWDTIGDVSVVPAGQQLPTKPPKKLESHTKVSFFELFHQGATTQLDASIPGVQEKISDASITFNVSNARKESFILKLNPKRYPLLVQNEFFFLKVAASCGFKVNKAQLIYDQAQEPGLLITRFDRNPKTSKSDESDRSDFKLHQEDACQLLNRPPSQKYALTMRQVADVIQAQATAPIVECSRLLNWYVFCYLIGNHDLHAKNISLLWQDTVRLSPGYDVLSTLPYPKQTSPNMALQLEGKDKNFKPSDFASFGTRYGIPEAATLKAITQICTRTQPWLDKLPEIGFDTQTTTTLRTEIADRIHRLEN